MSMIKNSKRLKTAYSAQTDCTIDQGSQKGVKINVIIPKIKNKVKDVDESSIIEMVLQEENFGGMIDQREKLLNIPQLCKKQQEIIFWDASNSQSRHQYEGSGNNAKEYNKPEDSFACSLDLREMNIINSSNGKNVQQQSVHYDCPKNIISHQTNKKQQIQKGRKKKKEPESSDQSNKLMRSQRIIALKYENQEEFEGENDAEKKIAEKPLGLEKESKLSSIVSKMKLSDKYEMKEGERNKKIDNCRSNSRIKLKDYIYMVQTTSKQLRSSKYQNMNNQKREGNLNQVKSEQKIKGALFRLNEKNQGVRVLKKDRESKFTTSTTTMAQILQNDIVSEISRGEKMLKELSKLVSSQNFSRNTEPQSEKLMALYNIRRQLNEKMNNSLEGAVAKMNLCFQQEQYKDNTDSDAEEMVHQDLVKLSRSQK